MSSCSTAEMSGRSCGDLVAAADSALVSSAVFSEITVAAPASADARNVRARRVPVLRSKDAARERMNSITDEFEGFLPGLVGASAAGQAAASSTYQLPRRSHNPIHKSAAVATDPNAKGSKRKVGEPPPLAPIFTAVLLH